MEKLIFYLVMLVGLVTYITASFSFSNGDLEVVNLAKLLTIDNSDDDGKDSVSLQTFNRPIGTRALVINMKHPMPSPTGLYGRTFGQYGSYRNHRSWQKAVHADRRRHSIMHATFKDAFPWLFRNLKTPSATGFSLDGFWNSYAPVVPGV